MNKWLIWKTLGRTGLYVRNTANSACLDSQEGETDTLARGAVSPSSGIQ